MACSASASLTPVGLRDEDAEVVLVDAGAGEQLAVDGDAPGQVVLLVDALDGEGLGGAVGQRERERRAHGQPVALGLALAQQHPVRGQVRDLALHEVEVEHRADGRRVDDGHRPALAVDERVVDADPRGGAHLRQLVEVVRQLRAEAAEAEVVHADDEVAAELLAEDLADRVGDRRGQHGHPGHQGHADDERGGRAGGALRVAGGVLRGHGAGHPLEPGDGPAEGLGHRTGDERSEHEEGDEQDQHPWGREPTARRRRGR